MATYNKFQQFVEDLANKVHDLANDTLKLYLTNTLPVNTNELKSQLAEITAGNGYVAGGEALTGVTAVQTGGVLKLTCTNDPQWTASGGAIAQFRYAVLYNDTPTSPADPLIAWWDYGSAVDLADGEDFTANITDANGLLTIT